MLAIEILLILSTFFVFLLLCVALFNVVSSNRLMRDPFCENDVRPLVSVLIPARNESQRITPTILSVLSQEWKELEILVLDDNSEDNTSEVVQKLLASSGRDFKLMRGKQVPEGWLGKNYACAQLAERAKGKFLLFLDADVVLEPFVIEAALKDMKRNKIDLLTGFPEQLCQTFWEKCLVPLMEVFLYSCAPVALFNYFRSERFVAANGQFMIFSRTAYDTIGGHVAVQQEVVEDVALARLIKSKQLRIKLLSGQGAFYCRMYAGLQDIVQGFGKNIFPACNYSIANLMCFSVITILTFVVPFLCLVITTWALVPILLALLLRFVLALRYRHPITHAVLLHPFSILAGLTICFNSALQHVSGKANWKGRNITSKGDNNEEFPKGLLIFGLWIFLICGRLLTDTPPISYFKGTLTSLGILAFSALSIFFHLRNSASKKQRIKILGLIFSVSMAVEIIGVKTSMPFGNYFYTQTLQPQILGVPVHIGLAWAMITILASHLSCALKHKTFRCLCAGALCLVFDIALEPAATMLQLWQFQGNPPIQNYLSWFIMGALFSSMLSVKAQRAPENRIFAHLYFAQLCYFASLGFF